MATRPTSPAARSASVAIATSWTRQKPSPWSANAWWKPPPSANAQPSWRARRPASSEAPAASQAASTSARDQGTSRRVRSAAVRSPSLIFRTYSGVCTRSTSAHVRARAGRGPHDAAVARRPRLQQPLAHEPVLLGREDVRPQVDGERVVKDQPEGQHPGAAIVRGGGAGGG